MTLAMIAPRIRLMFTDRLTMSGKEYSEAEEISTGYVLYRSSGPKKAAETFTHAELLEASRAPDWRFEPEYFDPDKIRIRENSTYAAMHKSAAAETPWVYFKWQCVTRFLNYEAEGKTNRSKLQVERVLPWITRDIYASEDALAILQRKLGAAKRPKTPTATKRGPRTKPSGRKMQERFPCPFVRTFLRWLSKFEKGGLRPCALRDDYGACGRTRKLCEKQIEFVEKYAHQWLELNKIPLDQIHSEMKDEVEAYNAGLPPASWISCPSKDAIRRFVGGMSKFAVYAKRYGEDRARAKFVLSSGGPEVVRPGQRVEADHYKADIMMFLRQEGLLGHLSAEQVRRIGRMELCAALDVATKCILGAHLSETPTAADGRRVLRMAVSDKTSFAKDAGAETPWDMSANIEMVATDAGPAFIDTNFTSTVYNLGATHLIPPGASPWLRGPGERVFQTIHTGFLSRFKGRTFGNYMKRRGHKPEDFAHLTVDELATLLTLWIVDVYHNTPHDGLAGETPRNAWKRLAGLVGVRPLPDRRKIRAIFGECLERQLSGEGLLVLGHQYQDERLGALFLRKGEIKVQIKLDTWDIGAISYQDGDEWYEAKCIAPGFDGVSADMWSRTVRDVRQGHTAEAQKTAGVVYAALKIIKAESAASQARANIATQTLSAAAIQNLEDSMFQGFRMPTPSVEYERSQAPNSPGLLGRSFETGGDAITASPALTASDLESDPAEDASDSYGFEN